MDAKGVMNSDLETLEEKLQILQSKMGQEEYETIRKEIDEIRKLGADLPDSGYMASVNDIIKRVVDLEVSSFSDKTLKETIKEVKKEGFLARLEYIKLCAIEGKDVSQIFSVVGQYWNAIKGTFDAFEVSEIERKLEEVKLEILLKKVQTSKEVESNEIEEVNYLLIRERLINLLKNENISEKNRLLINSWLGESLDTETGKVSAEFMGNLLKRDELWEVLSGVKGVKVIKVMKVMGRQGVQERQASEIPQATKQTQALMSLGESQRRAQEIIKLGEKYNIPLKKFDLYLYRTHWDDYKGWISKNEYAVYVVRYKRFGKIKYKLIGEDEAVKLRQKGLKAKKTKNKKTSDKKVVAVVFNNHVTEILEAGHTYQSTLEDVVFPDALQKIGKFAFCRTSLRGKIDIPETVEEIGASAFEGTHLQEADIPGSVKVIGDRAFFATPLAKLSLGEGVEEIGTQAFVRTDLKELDIPGSVKKIGTAAFFGNIELEVVKMREGIEEIGEDAFCQNIRLRSVSIPKGVKYEMSTFPAKARITVWGVGEEKIKLKDNEEESEIEKLRKENRALREEIDVLKKKIAKFEELINGTKRKSETMEK